MPVSEGTSVAPRQRPKGSQAPPGVGGLPLMPQGSVAPARRLTPTTPQPLVPPVTPNPGESPIRTSPWHARVLKSVKGREFLLRW